MITLKNHQTILKINELGAEPVSFWCNGMEWLWQADPAFWPRHAPVLFPIVGKLKDNSFFIDDKSYHLPQHGFARDKSFDIIHHDESSATFLLKDDENTRTQYPFPFKLEIKYEVSESSFSVSYQVYNPGSEHLLFSIGAHPGFKCPVFEGSELNNYSLKMNVEGPWTRSLLTDGLFNGNQVIFGQGFEIPLDDALFEQDAIVLENFAGNQIEFMYQNKSIFTFAWKGFKHLGIWKKIGAPFICLEPWNGLADAISHDGQLENKNSLITLQPNQIHTCNWELKINL